jgi:methylated-DNA-[protein]-cysteine S-methyltransferase
MVTYSNGGGCSIICRRTDKISIVAVRLENIGAVPPPHTATAAILNLMEEYLAGKAVELPLAPLDLSGLTPFALRVLSALRQVPRGSTISYAELAKLARCPNGARAVGNVLRHNPFPLFFPCHRVVNSNGAIGGFMGKTGKHPAVQLKLQLLRYETIR